MISRKTTMVIASAIISKFSKTTFGSGGSKKYADGQSFYDFLYENEYEAWFCNIARRQHSIRLFKEWIMQIHTGESFQEATSNWPGDKRRDLGQQYLKNLARDFIVWFREQDSSRADDRYKAVHDELVRRLEIDGYVFRDGQLYQPEVEVLDVEAETGLLENLHDKMQLSDKEQTFGFLGLAEEHYVAGRWSDSIGNSRKFFEAILQQVAQKYSLMVKGTALQSDTFDRPSTVRNYLENEGLIEKKEKEAISKIYQLLSQTGSHPYMAEKDQSRLLRQLCVTLTQFVLLRLEGALV